MHTASIPALSLLLVPLGAQADWTLLRPTASPVGLSDVAMAHDSARGRTVLHGGWDGGRDLSDTWEFDGRTWTKLGTATNPGPRSSQGMAYDAARGQVLMFGGYCGNNCTNNTTWTFDGKDWTRQNPAQAPGPRMGFGMAYDPDRQRVVLFGGYCGNSSCVYDDTWEWDGRSWQQLSPAASPPARFSTRMVYDRSRREMLVYGGRSATQRFGDTWAFDGRTWTQRRPQTSPGIRTAHGMSYDQARARVVLHGGYDGLAYNGDTWEWDGQDWRQRRPTTSPSPRGFAAMCYEGARQQTLVFGGQTNQRETWRYQSGALASYEPYGAGCKGAAATPLLGVDGDQLPWLGARFQVLLGGLSATTSSATITLGTSQRSWGSLSLPFDLRVLGAPGCLLLASLENAFVVPARGGQATWSVAVPNVASVLGGRFYNQAYVLDGANALGLVVSNAAAGRVGAR